MDHVRSTKLVPALRRTSHVLAQASVATGCWVLLSWALDLPSFRDMQPGLANMTVNSAIGFVLVGLALLAQARGWNTVCRVLAAFLVWRGALRLFGAAYGLELGLDQWLFPGIDHGHGGMAVLTATNFLLIGAALLFLGVRWGRQVLSEWLAAAVALLALMALLGKAYGSPVPFFVGPIAIHSSLAFLACSLAVILADPHHGVAGILADGGPSGLLARRLLPAAMGVPFILGWLSLAGEERGLYKQGYALSLLALGCIACAVSLSIWVARSVKKAGFALSEGEERFRVTLRSIGDGVIAVDLEMRVTTVNAVAERLTGWIQEEAEGRPLQEVFRIGGSVGHEPMADPIMMALRLDETFEVKEPFILITRGGQEITVADSSAPIHDAEGRMIGAVLVFRDVTTKQRADKELLKLQKLESLAVLAAGIAHDFNNILSVILANISLAAERGPSQAECLRDAEEAVSRGAQLSGQLIAFAKGSATVRRPVALGPVIEEAARFALTGTSSRVTFDLGAAVAVAEADPGQISQVLQNLVLNASQAMPSGGVVHVTLRSVDLSTGDPLALALEPGRYHKIVVSDEGQGIRPEVLDHIFEPFFSTKAKGNGLGLASAFSIAKGHRGLLTAETVLGQGSAFSLYLPASDKSLPVQTGKPRQAVGGRGRVLVMDDDDSIRRVTLRMLSSLGHRAEGAAEGTGAIALLAAALKEGDPFDVVILDLTVPGGMGGLEAASKMLALQPGLQVVVASGYSADPVMEDYAAHGFAAAMVKPYNLHTMGEVLAGLIAD